MAHYDSIVKGVTERAIAGNADGEQDARAPTVGAKERQNMALNELGRQRDSAAGVDQTRHYLLLCGAAMAVMIGLPTSA